MDITSFVKLAGALLTVAICSACGSSTVSPLSTPLNAHYAGRTLFVNGTPVTAARVNLSPLPRYTMTIPDPRARSKFEYVINYYGTYASIFDYPKSDKEIGKINNVGGQGCTNVLYGYGKSTFWIVAAFNQITEYAVPKTPIKTLSDSVGMPSSCAMDISGDLAVGILNGARAGAVVIYKNASGSGTVMSTPLAREYFDGYDPNGNLFADGFTSGGSFELVELPKGSSKFETITTSNTLSFPGSVQWDGEYITVLDQDANAISRYTVSGTKATLEGAVTLTGSTDCAQSWIVTGIVYCGDAGNNNGEVFKYPAGGSPIAVLTGSFDIPLGVVAAVK